MGSVERAGALNRPQDGFIRQPERTARSNRAAPPAQFERSLSRYNAVGEQSKSYDDPRQRSEQQELAEAARQRTIEELRAIVKAVQYGETDPEQLTDLIFYARHPELLGLPLTEQDWLDEWNCISALLVHPALGELGDFLGADFLGSDISSSDTNGASAVRVATDSYSQQPPLTNRFDQLIARAVEWCPGLSPAVFKSLLAQESGFNPTVINQYGYAGIAQIGRDEAREAGLTVGIAGSAMDERLNPRKAIPAAARLLNLKAQRLAEAAFSRYGQPSGVEFWKFVIAAYNGGEGTIALAMGHAHRLGLSLARARGLVGNDAISFARNYASRWDNLVAGGARSPLAQAAARYFPDIATAKYYEIGDYPNAIIARSAGQVISLTE